MRVKFAKAKAKMLLQKLTEAQQILEDIFTNVNPNLLEAHVLYGHCKFLNHKLPQAVAAYYKAIRIANLSGVELKDPLVHQRIGAALIDQK